MEVNEIQIELDSNKKGVYSLNVLIRESSETYFYTWFWQQFLSSVFKEVVRLLFLKLFCLTTISCYNFYSDFSDVSRSNQESQVEEEEEEEEASRFPIKKRFSFGSGSVHDSSDRKFEEEEEKKELKGLHVSYPFQPDGPTNYADKPEALPVSFFQRSRI